MYLPNSFYIFREYFQPRGLSQKEVIVIHWLRSIWEKGRIMLLNYAWIFHLDNHRLRSQHHYWQCRLGRLVAEMSQKVHRVAPPKRYIYMLGVNNILKGSISIYSVKTLDDECYLVKFSKMGHVKKKTGSIFNGSVFLDAELILINILLPFKGGFRTWIELYCSSSLMFKGPTSEPKVPWPSSVPKFTVREMIAKGTYSSIFNNRRRAVIRKIMKGVFKMFKYKAC